MEETTSHSTTWRTVWESSPNSEYKATLSVAAPNLTFSLIIRRESPNGYVNILPLNRKEAMWLLDNLKEAQSSGYSTTTASGEVIRKLEVSRIMRRVCVLFKLVSRRKARHDLIMYVPIWKVDDFLSQVSEALSQFNQMFF